MDELSVQQEFLRRKVCKTRRWQRATGPAKNIQTPSRDYYTARILIPHEPWFFPGSRCHLDRLTSVCCQLSTFWVGGVCTSVLSFSLSSFGCFRSCRSDICRLRRRCACVQLVSGSESGADVPSISGIGRSP
jgi:hypothetical protein